MIIPIFSTVYIERHYNDVVKYIRITNVSPLNPLFPSFIHHHCLQILCTTNFLRENVLLYLVSFILLNK